MRAQSFPSSGLRPLIAFSLLVAAWSSAPAFGEEGPAPGAPSFHRSGLDIVFEVRQGKLRQLSFLPAGLGDVSRFGSTRRGGLDVRPPDPVSGVDVELQATGMNWNEHHGAKLIGGQPGSLLVYAGRRSEPVPGGLHEVLIQTDPESALRVESHYLFFDGVPVVRRWTRLE